jgi:hypothetical protein
MHLDSWRGGAPNHTWLRRGDLAGLVSASQSPNCGIISGSSSSPAGLLISVDQGQRIRDAFWRASPHRDLRESVHETTELEMFVFLILRPTLPSAPSLAVFSRVSPSRWRGSSVRPMVFHDLANQLWFEQNGPGT